MYHSLVFTILIVEDNAALADMLGAVVRSVGCQPVIAHTGAQAFAILEEEAPAAAIVDLLLPDVLGTEVLAALAAPALNVPAVAVTGVYKGAKYAEDTKQRYGARAFFEKPFSSQKLVATLEELLGRKPSLPEAPEAEEVVEGEPIEEPETTVPIAEAQARRRTKPKSIAFGQGRAGILQEYAVPQILAAAEQGRETGELTLHHGIAVKTIYFKRGRPAGASSNLSEERFPAIARAVGLDPQVVAEVAARAEAQGGRSGEAMVEAGIISAEDRRELCERQTREIVWSTFPWDEGVYEYRPLSQLPPWLLPVSLRTADVVLEGVRRAMPLVELRARLAPTLVLAPSPDPVVELHEVPFTTEEATVLVAADGTRSIEQLVERSKLDERATLATLYAARTLNLLTEVQQVLVAAKRARQI